MSKGTTGLAIVGLVVVGIVVSLLFAFPVMLLWNWLMPELFGLSTISFWQAIGLLLLSALLLKSTGSSSSSSK